MATKKIEPPDPEADAPAPDPEEAKIEAAAETLLGFVASLDPSWRERIDIMRSERGFDAKMTAASLMAYPLDNALHMSMTSHAMLQSGIRPNPSGMLTCENCGKEFKQVYGGQRALCGNDCARSYDARKKVLTASAA